jgi:hypothetical protein
MQYVTAQDDVKTLSRERQMICAGAKKPALGELLLCKQELVRKKIDSIELCFRAAKKEEISTLPASYFEETFSAARSSSYQ